jgi:hypothetical protein
MAPRLTGNLKIKNKIQIMNKLKRRSFIKKTASASAIMLFNPFTYFSGKKMEDPTEKWRTMMTDPVYDLVNHKPGLDHIMELFPGQQGEPAFDPGLIRANINKLKTFPEINTGHPFMDLSVRTALAHIDATFIGDHPKYGVGTYGQPEHDGFPPTIIAAVDALTAWGMNARAARLFSYWLENFVKEDGTFNYYGPSVSEYGQMLNTALLLQERAGGEGWFKNGFHKLDLITGYLLDLTSSAIKADALISGVPEADTRDQVAEYFHNNAWVVKGLNRWITLCKKTDRTPSTDAGTTFEIARKLGENTLSAIRDTWPSDPVDWWLPSRLGNTEIPHYLTENTESSYTNYRYWPELLSSGILPGDMANRLVNARLKGGGQFCGMTRFLDRLDDWPLTEYLYSLWALGRKEDFMISLYGHVSYHQCRDHLTAYEQFNFPGDPRGSKVADYCLPCQLVVARAGRLINK